jgi:hypothetical protein
MTHVLDQQIVEAGRRVHRARRHFHHERDREAMRAFLDAIDEYRATAHAYCVSALHEQLPPAETATMQEYFQVM